MHGSSGAPRKLFEIILGTKIGSKNLLFVARCTGVGLLGVLEALDSIGYRLALPHGAYVCERGRERAEVMQRIKS